MRRLPGPLLSHLPAIYHTSEELREVLSAFEAVLFAPEGNSGNVRQSQGGVDTAVPLEQAIANIALLFDAWTTPREFLPWLAQWVALSDISDLTEQQQRRLLAKIVPLYGKRGTKTYLIDLLKFFTPDNTSIHIKEEMQGFIVGSAEIGRSSRLEPERLFWFAVKICLPGPDGAADEREKAGPYWEQRLTRVIDLAKPAHTLYELMIQFKGNDRDTGQDKKKAPDTVTTH